MIFRAACMRLPGLLEVEYPGKLSQGALLLALPPPRDDPHESLIGLLGYGRGNPELEVIAWE